MLAGRAPVPVEIAEIPDERLPEPVEAAAYYLIAEALTNVAKYAQASDGARPHRAASDATVLVEVSDDGVGGADPATGSGLRGLADRVEALGGTLEVRARPAPERRCAPSFLYPGRSRATTLLRRREDRLGAARALLEQSVGVTEQSTEGNERRDAAHARGYAKRGVGDPSSVVVPGEQEELR